MINHEQNKKWIIGVSAVGAILIAAAVATTLVLMNEAVGALTVAATATVFGAVPIVAAVLATIGILYLLNMNREAVANLNNREDGPIGLGETAPLIQSVLVQVNTPEDAAATAAALSLVGNKASELKKKSWLFEEDRYNLHPAYRMTKTRDDAAVGYSSMRKRSRNGLPRPRVLDDMAGSQSSNGVTYRELQRTDSDADLLKSSFASRKFEEYYSALQEKLGVDGSKVNAFRLFVAIGRDYQIVAIAAMDPLYSSKFSGLLELETHTPYQFQGIASRLLDFIQLRLPFKKESISDASRYFMPWMQQTFATKDHLEKWSTTDNYEDVQKGIHLDAMVKAGGPVESSCQQRFYDGYYDK